MTSRRCEIGRYYACATKGWKARDVRVVDNVGVVLSIEWQKARVL